MTESAAARIALVVRWPTGGIRTHLKYLYRHLPPGKYVPVLVAPSGLETDYLTENLGIAPENALLVSSASVAEFARGVWSLCRRGRVDLIHSHGFTSTSIAAVPARLCGVPHVATIHDVLTEALRRRLGFSGTRVLSVALGLCDTVHAVGRDAAQTLRELPRVPLVRAPNVVTIRNGVDLTQFMNVVPRDIRADFGIPEGTFVVGFFGRFMAQKGFRVLIGAIDRLRRAGIPRPPVVLAVGEGGFLREDRQEVSRRGLDELFRFAPPMENPASSLAALDCLVMPSKWEALSVLAMEVLCVGVPLIASDCIGLREITQNTPARTVPVGDEQALADAIADEMRSGSVVRARQFAPTARQRFDVRLSAGELDRLFTSRLAGRGPKS